MNLRLCLLLGIAPLALAQISAVERGHLPAYLSFELTSEGVEQTTLRVPSRTMPGGLPEAFARAVGCRPDTIEPSPYEIRLTAKCPSSRPTRLTFQAALRLAQLTPSLHEAGITGIYVALMLPKFGRVEVRPAMAPNTGLLHSYNQTTYTLEQLPPEITINAGFDSSHLYTLAVGVVWLLILPFFLLLRPKNLAHLQASIQALFLIGWADLTWTLLRSQAWILCDHFTGHASIAPLLLLLIPLIAVWTGSRLAASNYARLAPNALAPSTYRRAKFWTGAAAIFLNLTIGTLLSTEPAANICGWTLAGLLGAGLCVFRMIRIARGSSHPLSPGPLRTRIFELAAKASSPLRGVTILTASVPRPPAAFATRRGVIMLTEGLLSRLSQREVDAVVCHELSHIRPARRATPVVLYVLISAIIVAGQLAPDLAETIPYVFMACWLIFKAWRRREERRADSDAVRWSGDPEALISGLARISQSHCMPLEWGPPASWILAHPCTGDRLRMIAAAGGLAPSRIPELIEESRLEARDHYVEPASVPEDAAFSPALRQQLKFRLANYAVLAPLVLGVAAARLLESAGLSWAAVLAFGAPLSMVALYLGYELLVGHVRSTVRNRAIARNGDGIFAGFSPAAEPRIFDGMYHYDSGLIRFNQGALEFLGDRTHFLLDRRLVTRVWLADGPPHWTPRKLVYVECRSSEGAALRIFSLQSFEALHWPHTTAAARELHRKIETWRNEKPTLQQPPPPCSLPEVQGDPDKSVALPAVLKSAIIYASVAFVISGLIGTFDLTHPLDFLCAPVLCAMLAIFAALPRLRVARPAPATTVPQCQN